MTGASSVPFDENAPAGGGGGYLPGGIGWYRKTFQLPDSFKGRQIAIEFDGVYENSDVWINGHRLGKRPFGYISFHYDLTPFLNFNQQANVLPSGWTTPSSPIPLVQRLGNLSPYVAESDRPLCIAPWGTFAITPQVSLENATVRGHEVGYQSGQRTGEVQSHLDDYGSGWTARSRPIKASRSLTPAKRANSGSKSRSTIPISGRTVNPYLYTVRATLRRGDDVVDQCDTPIGIRSIEFDVDKGFLLNGKLGKAQRRLSALRRRQRWLCRARRRVAAAIAVAQGNGLQRHPHEPQSRPLPNSSTSAISSAFSSWTRPSTNGRPAKRPAATTDSSTTGRSAISSISFIATAIIPASFSGAPATKFPSRCFQVASKCCGRWSKPSTAKTRRASVTAALRQGLRRAALRPAGIRRGPGRRWL